MLSSVAFTDIPFVALGGVFIVAGVLALLGQQVQKELSNAHNINQKLQIFGQVLVIGIIPLLIAILVIAITSFS